jgi:hypothetical protein
MKQSPTKSWCKVAEHWRVSLSSEFAGTNDSQKSFESLDLLSTALWIRHNVHG